MNIKNVLKFLPVAILTATCSTNGTEDKHNTDTPNTNTPNITNNNNYYSPVSNTNNTYYNNEINNQYPMYYGTLPTFLQPGFQLYQYPQFAQHPNIQNCHCFW